MIYQELYNLIFSWDTFERSIPRNQTEKLIYKNIET